MVCAGRSAQFGSQYSAFAQTSVDLAHRIRSVRCSECQIGIAAQATNFGGLFATIVQLLQTRTLGNLVVGLPHSYSLQFSVQPLANAPKSQVSRSSPTKHERRGVRKSLHASELATVSMKIVGMRSNRCSLGHSAHVVLLWCPAPAMTTRAPKRTQASASAIWAPSSSASARTPSHERRARSPSPVYALPSGRAARAVPCPGGE